MPNDSPQPLTDPANVAGANEQHAPSAGSTTPTLDIVPPEPEWSTCKSQLGAWRSWASARAIEHTDSAGWRHFWGALLGIPTTMLTTIVGTAVFASWQQNATPSQTTALVVAILSMSAAILTGLQTFFRFSERAARHQTDANRAHSICADIDLLLACPPKQEELRDIMKGVKDQVVALGVESSSTKTLLKMADQEQQLKEALQALKHRKP